MSAVEASVFRHPSSTVDQVVLNADGSFGGELASELGSKLDLAGGKILQIVRATDATLRTTTSTSFVDANISVTITPQKNNSAILLIHSSVAQTQAANGLLRLQITDNSNNAISGSELRTLGDLSGSETITSFTAIAYATPATTSPITYKVRFRTGNAANTARLINDENTGQMFAIEVSA